MNCTLKNILTSLFLSITFTSFGQSKIKGKIIDTNSNIPLAMTQIKNTNNEVITTSNLDGTFELSNSGLYSFKKEGYILGRLKLEPILKIFL